MLWFKNSKYVLLHKYIWCVETTALGVQHLGLRKDTQMFQDLIL